MELKVAELTAKEEVGRGIVRIDNEAMKNLGIKEEDIVEIKGKRRTTAIAIRSYPADVGLNIIRMDVITVLNAGTLVGKYVKVERADVKKAKKVVLAPTEKGVIIHLSPNLVKQNIYMRPMVRGDIIFPSPAMKKKGKEFSLFEEFFGENFEDVFFTPFPRETRLMVVDTEPKGIVKVTDKTEIEILPRAVDSMIIKGGFSKEKIFDVKHNEKIIHVKTLPSLKKMIELTDLDEFEKLSKSYYINRYEDKKQIVYFADKWYYIVKKGRLTS